MKKRKLILAPVAIVLALTTACARVKPWQRGTLADPGFPALATQLGLFKYWTTTHTRPDVCDEKAPPPFCGMI